MIHTCILGRPYFIGQRLCVKMELSGISFWVFVYNVSCLSFYSPTMSACFLEFCYKWIDSNKQHQIQ